MATLCILNMLDEVDGNEGVAHKRAPTTFMNKLAYLTSTIIHKYDDN